MSKDNQIEIEVINYEQDRHYFFVDQVSLAQKKYDRLFKTFKDAPYASEGAQFLSDAGREVQFYKDIVEILDKGYRKATDVVEVRHGEWVDKKCSVCGEDMPYTARGNCFATTFYQFKTKYCQHCGAKMDGERREQ